MDTTESVAAPSAAPAAIPRLQVSIEEAARLLDCCTASVYTLLKNKKLKGRKEGRLTKIDYASIVQHVQNLPEWTPGKQGPGLAGKEHTQWNSRRRKQRQVRRQRTARASA